MNKFLSYGDGELVKIELEDRDGHTYDIRHIQYEVSLFEDIYSPFMSGSVNIIDSNNITEKLKIMGGEKIHVEINTPTLSDSVKYTGVVYKISDIDRKDHSTDYYTIFFISEEYFNDHYKTVSKSYKTEPHKIVKSLFGELDSDKKFDSHKASFEHRIIVPHMTVTQTIQQLSTLAVSEAGACDFLFFETVDGFHFKSIHEMMNEDGKATYNQNFDLGHVGVPEQHTFKFTNIESLELEGRLNLKKHFDNGSMGGYTHHYDISNHSYTQSNVSPKDYQPKLGSDFVGEPIKAKQSAHGHWHIFDSQRHDEFELPERKFGSREMALGRLEHDAIYMEVSGNSALRAGDIIDVNLPSKQPDTNEISIDRKYSGRRIITQLRHIYTGTKYVSVIRACKDGLNE